MLDRTWHDGAYLAEFESLDDLSRAVRALEDKGYTRIETYSPVPLEPSPRRGRSRLPVAVFVAGLVGAILSYGIQWYADAYAYPIDIGGRPAHAAPAFVVSTFEGTVLCAALAAFFGFFVIARLPQPYHPVFEIDGFERATVDRNWIAVDAGDRRSSPDLTPRELHRLDPLRVVTLEAER
jgi:hypothetical protein